MLHLKPLSLSRWLSSETHAVHASSSDKCSNSVVKREREKEETYGNKWRRSLLANAFMLISFCCCYCFFIVSLSPSLLEQREREGKVATIVHFTPRNARDRQRFSLSSLIGEGAVTAALHLPQPLFAFALCSFSCSSLSASLLRPTDSISFLLLRFACFAGQTLPLFLSLPLAAKAGVIHDTCFKSSRKKMLKKKKKRDEGWKARDDA